MVPYSCMMEAAAAFHIPATSIQMVIAAPHEAGSIGIMGIPPDWLPTLARYGFNPDKVETDSCTNIRAGAWIISINPRARIVEVSHRHPGPPAPVLPQCAIDAAAEYRVPLAEVDKVLSAPHPARSAGPMGIPLDWLPTLTHYGFNSDLVLHDRCMGLVAGEWILGVEEMQNIGLDKSAYPVPADAMINPPLWLLPMVLHAATAVRLPPALILAVAAQESHFHPYVTSPVGAEGLMQLMPDTAAAMRVADPYSPEQSLMGGARYLSSLFTEFDGNLPLVLAAYNAGDQAVINYGQHIPPFRETENYVPAVLARYALYKAKLDDSGDYKGADGPVKPVEHELHIPARSLQVRSILVRREGLAGSSTSDVGFGILPSATVSEDAAK